MSDSALCPQATPNSATVQHTTCACAAPAWLPPTAWAACRGAVWPSAGQQPPIRRAGLGAASGLGPHLEQGVRQVGPAQQAQVAAHGLRPQLGIRLGIALAGALCQQAHEVLGHVLRDHVPAQLKHLRLPDGSRERPRRITGRPVPAPPRAAGRAERLPDGWHGARDWHLVHDVQEPLRVRGEALRQLVDAADGVQLLRIVAHAAQVLHHLVHDDLRTARRLSWWGAAGQARPTSRRGGRRAGAGAPRRCPAWSSCAAAAASWT